MVNQRKGTGTDTLPKPPSRAEPNTLGVLPGNWRQRGQAASGLYLQTQGWAVVSF
jgi:hypothetical protein